MYFKRYCGMYILLCFAMMGGGGGGGSSNYDVHISGGTVHGPYPGVGGPPPGSDKDKDKDTDKDKDKTKDSHTPPDDDDTEKVPGKDYPYPGTLPTNPTWPPLIPKF